MVKLNNVFKKEWRVDTKDIQFEMYKAMNHIPAHLMPFIGKIDHLPSEVWMGSDYYKLRNGSSTDPFYEVVNGDTK